MRRALLLVPLLLALGCKPKPVPVVTRPDSAAVAPDTTDSVGTDSTLLDQQDGYWFDGNEVDTMPDTQGELPKQVPGRRGAVYQGVAQGMYNYPIDKFTWNGPFNAVAMNVPPAGSADRIRNVCATGMRIVMVIPRRYITTTGGNKAPFSPSKGDAVVDAYKRDGLGQAVAACPRALLSVNLADDYGCAECWGGKITTQQQIYAWAKYWKQQLPNIPIGVRVEPAWILKVPSLGLQNVIDNANCQYRTKKGPIGTYLPRCVADAKKLGLKLIGGMNVTHGVYAGSPPPLTPDQIRTFGGAYARESDVCAVVNWWVDDNFSKADYQKAYVDVASILRARSTTTNCTRGGPTATAPDSFPADSGVATDSATVAPAVIAAETSAAAPDHGHRHR